MADNKVSLLPDNAITELSKKVYTDVAHPAFKEVGNIGESIMKFVALPFKFLGLTADQLEVKYSKFLKKTIAKVPKTDCVIPKSVVAAPLLDHVKFIFDEDGLSEMFSNLLANAMSSNVEKMVHPAFVEMLKQMSPLDTEFMNLFFSKNDLVEISDLDWARGSLQKSLTVDSLTRLGIVNSITYDNRDDVALTLTDFGKIFRDLCMLSPAEIDPNDFFIENDEVLNDDYFNASKIGFMFQDSFATARKSNGSDKLYVRQRFQIEDVKKGSSIIILLRINNISKENKRIDSVYLDCASKQHILADTPLQLPVKISKGKYMDFIFIATSQNNLLEEAVKQQSKYVFQTGSKIYELPISKSAKKEIALFLKYNKRGGDNDE